MRWVLSAMVVLVLCAAATPAHAATSDPARVAALLDWQAHLADDLPLRNAPWWGTHNSFNSVAELGPSLSAQDPNQKITLTAQLDLGLRTLELDLHTIAGKGPTPIVCHGLEGGVGCSGEPPFSAILPQIGDWLRAHPQAQILLYLEDQLDGAEAHELATQTIANALGGLVYRPKAGAGCQKLPLELTRKQMRAANTQVLIMGSCGEGASYPKWSFDGSDRKEDQPRPFSDWPECGKAYPRAVWDASIIRYFEDSTRLSKAVADAGHSEQPGRITTTNARDLAHCGVDLLGLDQVVPGDPRLNALIWSWAVDEPTDAHGACAVQRVDGDAPHGRWYARGCRSRRRVACRRGDGSWLIPAKATVSSAARKLCARAKSARSAPRTGEEAARLADAMTAANVTEAWLALHRFGTSWTALDTR